MDKEAAENYADCYAGLGEQDTAPLLVFWPRGLWWYIGIIAFEARDPGRLCEWPRGNPEKVRGPGKRVHWRHVRYKEIAPYNIYIRC